MQICSIDGCGGKHRTRGFCRRHYYSLQRYGNPLHVEQTYNLSFEDKVKINSEWQGDCLVWTGPTNEKGYGYIYYNGKSHRVHRAVWEKSFGDIPKGIEIDHKCHNRACIRTEHLRQVTRKQNMYNISGAVEHSTTGEVNINIHSSGKYIVQLMKDKKHYYYGLFDTIEEAKPVRDKARETLFGKYRGVQNNNV